MSKVRRDRARLYRRCVAQKQGIERHFDCFLCRMPRSDELICDGKMSPEEDCDTYDIQIRYSPPGVPTVRILSPKLVKSPKIHLYNNESLCLYFPDDDPWKSTDLIYKKLIPWTAEWLLYYEIFLVIGDWQGPEAPHSPP